MRFRLAPEGAAKAPVLNPTQASFAPVAAPTETPVGAIPEVDQILAGYSPSGGAADSGIGNATIPGTTGNDSLTGTGASDSLSGGDGNDTLNGGGGADTAIGGNGNDYIFAVLGTPESINGGAGIDTLNTAAFTGNYSVNLATGATNFAGESFINMENLISGAGDDSLTGTGGANSISGGDGNDTINGGGGADTSLGGAGDDYIFGVLGTPESINGGSGNDTLDTTAFTGNYVVNLASGLTNFAGESFLAMENLISGAGNDSLTGTGAANLINGGTGNDTINGGGGADTSLGGDGNDYIFAVLGTPESINGGAGNDTLDTSAFTGNYVVNLATGLTNFSGESYIAMENLISGAGNDSLTGTGGANSINGGDGNDTINAAGGADTSLGGNGDDYIFAVLGTPESINGGAGIDTLDTTAFTGSYVVNLATGLTNFSGESFLAMEHLISGSGSDSLTGTGGANSISGGDGNDTINGGGGADTALGGNGDDYIFAVLGTPETIDGGAGIDTLDTSAFTGSYVVNLSTGVTNFSGESFLNMEHLISGAGSDSLTGTGGANTISGGEGNDTIRGSGGADTLNGNAGDDLIYASTGTTESFDGGDGIDTLNTTLFTTNYTVNLATGATTFAGELFVNFENLIAGSGNDFLTGSGVANSISGGNGDDTINGGGGADTTLGGSGNDYIYAVAGTPETIDGGSGTDTLDTTAFTGSYVVNLATGLTDWSRESFVNMENLISGIGNDTLTGTAGANAINGGDGNDAIDGSAGNDTLTGGLGNDTYYVNVSTDNVVEAHGQGTDTVISSATYTLFGRAAEVLTLTAGNINGTGNSLANTLNGSTGNNVLDGGTGSDTLTGGLGDDTYYVDNVGDKVVEAGNEGTDVIFSTVTYTLNARLAETLTLTGAAHINATGNSVANTLNGNDGNNNLDGGGSHDRLNGGLGTDTMIGGTGAGNDTFVVDNVGDVVTELAGGGTDLVESSITYVLGADLEQLTLTGAAAINGTGNSGNNVLIGNSGNNVLTGGLGNDTYYVQNSTDNVVEGGTEGTADLIYSTATYTLNARFVETLILTGAAHVNATGNSLGNTLTGNSGNNTINGKGGADTMAGGLGADIFLFETGSGADRITDFSLAQSDTINISAYTGGVVNNAIVTQNGADVLITLGGGNVITVVNALEANVEAGIAW